MTEPLKVLKTVGPEMTLFTAWFTSQPTIQDLELIQDREGCAGVPHAPRFMDLNETGFYTAEWSCDNAPSNGHN